ncbi:hypothetical protein K7X08_007767 [Anisodus acutangulus]|uniref:Non-structural maintenance of chromosomes element 4 n=1 Tax=Anisodus acutangulus TaxID=402998 RepID=A0A9Q1RNQ5_9SOLA|nr:hypothetical protein K7X08_007767 [Anisodus acutangulus]
MEKLENDLLLACSVRRHGLENWEMVAAEFSSAIFNRRRYILDMSATKCKSMYENLKGRFKSIYQIEIEADDDDDESAFVKLMADKLQKAFIVALKEDVKRQEASIKKLSLVCYKLEVEERIKLNEEEGDISKKKLLENINININDHFMIILDVLRSHKHCCLFESRLHSQGKQHYTQQIRQHMDLQIIQNKLEQDVYSNMEMEFFRDLLLMFNNAIVYYPEETLQHSTALELKAIVVKEMGKKTLVPCEVVCGLAAAGNTMIKEKLARRKYKTPNKGQDQEGKDDIGSIDSEKFKEIMKEIENSHNEVKKPREQVADAEALFDLTKTLVASVRSHSADGITPYMFISSLLGAFGARSAKCEKGLSVNENTLCWKKIGLAVSPTFRNGRGCCTMIGLMNCEVKQPRKYTRRPLTKLYLRAQPKELDVNTEEKTDTDKNISTMFQILRKKKRVKLENLVLNRKSFAQNVENLFALSFLVKDGRVVIDVDENGSHFLSPRNGPDAKLVKSGEVKYSHFVFRLDFADWELLKNAVPEGEELMPNRDITASPVFAEANKPNKDISVNPVFTEANTPVSVNDARRILHITRVKKLSRNRGKVMLEASDVDSSAEIGDANIGNWSLKRKLL